MLHTTGRTDLSDCRHTVGFVRLFNVYTMCFTAAHIVQGGLLATWVYEHQTPCFSVKCPFLTELKVFAYLYFFAMSCPGLHRAGAILVVLGNTTDGQSNT